MYVTLELNKSPFLIRTLGFVDLGKNRHIIVLVDRVDRI